MASTPLVFRDTVKDIREESVITSLVTSKKLFTELPYRIAAVDLNGDGVNEWIVRQDKSSGCETNAACDFYVVGVSRNAPLLLGEFSAGKVGIDDLKSYGVSVLQVYNLKNDDFKFTRYRWNPQNYAFLP